MNITVYLGSSPGNDPKLNTVVRALGRWIGESGHALVYGGSRTGLMGALAESTLRAGVNTFCFFISMVAGYYLYCHYVLGFLPRSYMMIWVLMSFASFFLAMVCWYAKGEGAPAVLLSAVILGALLAQAVNLRIDRGFYVYHLMEVFTWLAGVLLLRRRGKEFAVEMGLSVVAAVLYQLILPHWG